MDISSAVSGLSNDRHVLERKRATCKYARLLCLNSGLGQHWPAAAVARLSACEIGLKL